MKSTNIALLHKHYDADKLATVVAEMQTLGTPTIKAVWMPNWDMWVALEGCHRLRAAHALGLTPEIEEVEYSDDLTDMDDGEPMAVSAICDDANRSFVLTF